MELTSRDGGWLRLCPEGYQLGGPEAGAPGDDGDDWLVVGARVRTAEGGEWHFTQPCLTTDEAAALATWLERVAAGTVAPSPAAQPRSRLTFAEPNLAFSVEAAGADGARVRVHFSHESMPPWRPDHDWPDCQSYFIVLDVGAADLVAAAAQWRTEIARFPTRAPASGAAAPGTQAGSA